MATEEAVEALATAFFGHARTCAVEIAEEMIGKLEAQGFTVYKKKVFKHKRRPPSSVRMTNEMRLAIRAAFEQNPKLTQHEIAEMFNVNHGRVSEALGAT